MDIESTNAPNDDELDQRSTWDSCCLRCDKAAVKFISIYSLVVATLGFSAGMIAANPTDLEIRSSFLPLISGTLALFIDIK